MQNGLLAVCRKYFCLFHFIYVISSLCAFLRFTAMFTSIQLYWGELTGATETPLNHRRLHWQPARVDHQTLRPSVSHTSIPCLSSTHTVSSHQLQPLDTHSCHFGCSLLSTRCVPRETLLEVRHRPCRCILARGHTGMVDTCTFHHGTISGTDTPQGMGE